MFFAELLEALCTSTHFVHGHAYKVCECSRTVPLLYADTCFVRGQCLFSTGSEGKQQTKSADLDAFAYSPRTLLLPSMCR